MYDARGFQLRAALLDIKPDWALETVGKDTGGLYGILGVLEVLGR